jgi:hypothetical protein
MWGMLLSSWRWPIAVLLLALGCYVQITGHWPGRNRRTGGRLLLSVVTVLTWVLWLGVIGPLLNVLWQWSFRWHAELWVTGASLVALFIVFELVLNRARARYRAARDNEPAC